MIKRLADWWRGRKYGRISFSQCGEDLLIRYIFNLRGLDKITYLDIGAHHPFHFSNTAYFYRQGCRGVNVEANQELFSLFEKHRSSDINLNLAVGPVESVMDFYVMEDSTLSTFSQSELEKFILAGKKLKGKVPVKIYPLEFIIREYCNNIFPHLLSLDVEGFDLEILKSIDFKKSYPLIICVEAAEYSPIGAGNRRSDLIEFLVNNNYYEYANTNLNAIMVRKEFWFR